MMFGSVHRLVTLQLLVPATGFQWHDNVNEKLTKGGKYAESSSETFDDRFGWQVRVGDAAVQTFTAHSTADEGVDELLHELPPPEALQALDDLWAGSDMISPALEQFRPSDQNVAVGQRGQLPKLQILGTFDVGTNLLWELLRANLGAQVMKESCMEGHADGDISSCWFWKHAPPQNLSYEVDHLQQDGRPVVLVAMVRSPLAVMAGWIKAPYDLKECMNTTEWWDYHASPCTLNKEYGDRRYSDSFSGVTGVWNSYVQEYDRYSGNNRRQGVIGLIVEYERLVLQPEGVVREVADAMGVDTRETFHGVGAPSKSHGHSHGREKAIKDIQEMGYLRKKPMSDDAVRVGLCANLDAAAMGQHAVPAVPLARSYADDCKWSGP
jgi:hypothetical protein